MENYILLYGDKKKEDNICIKNMFKNNKQINLGWTDFDYNKNMKTIEELIESGIKQIIFSGLEIGWNKEIKDLKEKYKDIKIKVICTTQDSLLYYDYERQNFFDLLELSKNNVIDDIAFLRKGQYEIYKSLGYKCSFLRENYILDKENKKEAKKKNEIIDIGIYPLNYTWDKNIFNQLCIAKYIENSNLNYNELDERMTDFVNTMDINGTIDKIEDIDEKSIIEKTAKNDINISLSFTEYMHPVFWISMEQGVPCIIGNTIDFLQDEKVSKLKKYIVTTAEDNSIINSKMVEKCLENKDEIIKLYKEWKEEYNKLAEQSLKEFIEK